MKDLKSWANGFLVMGVFLGFLIPNIAVSQSDLRPDIELQPMISDWVPFPWSIPQEFPWEGVQGTWRSFESNPDLVFTLKVIKQKNSMGKLLSIKVIDPKTCQIIAQGNGLERSHVVKGQLNSKKFGVLRVAFGSFEPAMAKRQIAGLYTDGIFAVSMTKLKDTRPMVELQIVKESPQDLSTRFCPQE